MHRPRRGGGPGEGSSASVLGGRGHSPTSDGELNAPPIADPLIGVVVADRYRIVELLGRGGMGIVYKVEHVRIGKLLAMKLLAGELSHSPEVVRRFKREALTVSRLQSPSTVQVFDFGVSGGMSDYLSNRLIDLIWRDEAYVWPSNLYAAYTTTAPTNAALGLEPVLRKAAETLSGRDVGELLEREPDGVEQRVARAARGVDLVLLEALATMPHLHEALLTGRDAIFVLHGHGTGILRQAIRTHFHEFPGVRSARPAEPSDAPGAA